MTYSFFERAVVAQLRASAATHMHADVHVHTSASSRAHQIGAARHQMSCRRVSSRAGNKWYAYCDRRAYIARSTMSDMLLRCVARVLMLREASALATIGHVLIREYF